ncbi:hypothetical protein D9758_012658 [Tetrapyrgos nigripes]|uniref:Uncharacterized protein n=1 Tax=Tetrapyrgos nigripes TaxID=182062 RepID=A0A8H5GDN9_9AGAR|nr:hypothetical protein D9758_012658 [Tetrapyrgos nigripes]
MSTSTGIVGKDKGDDWDGYEDGFEDNDEDAWRTEWGLVPREMLSEFRTPREEVVGTYSNKGNGKGKGEDEEGEEEGTEKEWGIQGRWSILVS